MIINSFFHKGELVTLELESDKRLEKILHREYNGYIVNMVKYIESKNRKAGKPIPTFLAI